MHARVKLRREISVEASEICQENEIDLRIEIFLRLGDVNPALLNLNRFEAAPAPRRGKWR